MALCAATIDDVPLIALEHGLNGSEKNIYRLAVNMTLCLNNA